MNGILSGMEGDIRQLAAKKLFDRYLAGNSGLIEATKAGSVSGVRSSLAQALYAAVNFSKLEILEREQALASKQILADDIERVDHRSTSHPSQRRSLWELPVELQVKLVYAGLGLAVRDKRIPRQTAEMIKTLIEEDCSVAEIANRIKISPQAAHQRIKRAGVYLKRYVEISEFPL